jgi:hypothetical protein
MAQRFEDIDQLRHANQSTGQGFFEKSGQDHACTRIETYLLGHLYFVTSELLADDPTGRDRRYSIRRANPDATIETVGQYQAYDSINQAQKAIYQLLNA